MTRGEIVLTLLCALLIGIFIFRKALRILLATIIWRDAIAEIKEKRNPKGMPWTTEQKNMLIRKLTKGNIPEAFK